MYPVTPKGVNNAQLEASNFAIYRDRMVKAPIKKIY